MRTRIIDELFLELSQFTTAKTKKESQAEADKIVVKKILKANEKLEAKNNQLQADIERMAKQIDEQNKEIDRLKEEIVQLKTQTSGGSENDSCAIEGMDEGQALKDKP